MNEAADRSADPVEVQQRFGAVQLAMLFPQFFDAAPDAVIVVDRDGIIRLANQQTSKLFGYEPHELQGELVEQLIPERFQGAHVGHRDRFMDEAQVRPMGAGLDLWGRRKDGSEFPVEISLSPVPTGAGLLVLASIRDMTEQAQAQAAVRRYADQLERSNEYWEQFAYVVSHDLREPLRTIHSYVQLLERRYSEALGEEGRELMGFVTDGAARMARLIDGMLTYSRVDTQGEAFEPTDLDPVLDGVLENLHLLLDESGGEVTRDPLPSVLADRAQMAQVFQNLLSNALKFRSDDPPRIHVSATRQGARWDVTISDNGLGIPPEQHDRVFRIFQRLHGRNTYEGEGLGLAVVKRIVERHGGRVSLTSNDAGGTTVHVVLPDGDPKLKT